MNQAETLVAVEHRLEDSIAGLGAGGIGFVGPDVPIDVLMASGRAFGHLPWQTTAATPWADRWLESSFPYWARSILEQWHAGRFDALETVVFSRADDASQRLYYYVAELQRRTFLHGPKPIMFDIALVQRESSIAHTGKAITKLCHRLEVGPVLLSEAIERANALRRTLARIDAARLNRGSLHERVARAALWSDPTQWIDAIVIADQAESDQRVLLAGSVPPDDRIHDAVEAAGGSIVAEAHSNGTGRLGPEVSIGTDGPELALAHQLHAASISPRAMIDRGRWIVESASAAHAVTVIIWLTREDEALAWHVPSQMKALAATGLRTLLLPAAHWRFDDQARDRLTEFLKVGVHAAT